MDQWDQVILGMSIEDDISGADISNSNARFSNLAVALSCVISLSSNVQRLYWSLWVQFLGRTSGSIPLLAWSTGFCTSGRQRNPGNLREPASWVWRSHCVTPAVAKAISIQGQGTGHTSWWSLYDTPVLSTNRASTPGEPRSIALRMENIIITISHQLVLEPRGTGSNLDATHSVLVNMADHIVLHNNGCQLILSTPPYCCISIWSVVDDTYTNGYVKFKGIKVSAWGWGTHVYVHYRYLPLEYPHFVITRTWDPFLVVPVLKTLPFLVVPVIYTLFCSLPEHTPTGVSCW